MNVLIADDDRVFARLVQKHLEGAGCATRVVYDATQTWTQIVSAPPDLLVLDVKMPGGTGLGVLAKMKRLPRTAHIPVVVVTAANDPITLGEVREQGPDALLLKPVTMTALDEEISRLQGLRKI